jgi:hypothetical protein
MCLDPASRFPFSGFVALAAALRVVLRGSWPETQGKSRSQRRCVATRTAGGVHSADVVFCAVEVRCGALPQHWYAVPMIGTGYALQAADISSARDTGKTIGFNITSTNCSDNSPDGAGVVPVPTVQSLSIRPLPGQ